MLYISVIVVLVDSKKGVNVFCVCLQIISFFIIFLVVMLSFAITFLTNQYALSLFC